MPAESLKTCPPRDIPPCDPIHPGDGFFAAWEVVQLHRGGVRMRVARPLGAYPLPETTAILCQEEAVHCGGFFQTILMTDPLGRVVGQWSITTMAHNPDRESQAAPQSICPPMVRAVVDLAGISDDMRFESRGALEYHGKRRVAV